MIGSFRSLSSEPHIQANRVNALLPTWRLRLMGRIGIFLENTIGRYYSTSNTSMAAGILGGGTS
jgi:hypothetical protein